MKLKFKLICLLLALSMAFVTLTACNNNEGENEDEGEKGGETSGETVERVAADALYSDNGYIDYAKDVYFDTEKYPDLNEQGLFWAKWDAEKQDIVLVHADSQEGAQLIDADKPTLINIHGLLLDGYYLQENLYASTVYTKHSEFDLNVDEYGQKINMMYVWMRQGWNVGIFHYNRFASDEGLNPGAIEGKLWATDTPLTNIRYRKEDKTYVDNATEYCIAEHFAAEYIRAVNLLPSDFGKKEIRISAHSMGGELGSAALFLLTELEQCGQLKTEALPDRFAMLDPYFSITLTIQNQILYMGPKDITIRWSGKKLYKNNTGATTVEALKAVQAAGIAIEYYSYEQSFLRIGLTGNEYNDFLKICTYVIMNPSYENYKGYSIATDGHVAVRVWYMMSILSEPVKDSTGGVSGKTAMSASNTTDDLRSKCGQAYHIVSGEKTLSSADDVFETGTGLEK